METISFVAVVTTNCRNRRNIDTVATAGLHSMIHEGIRKHTKAYESRRHIINQSFTTEVSVLTSRTFVLLQKCCIFPCPCIFRLVPAFRTVNKSETRFHSTAPSPSRTELRASQRSGRSDRKWASGRDAVARAEHFSGHLSSSD